MFKVLRVPNRADSLGFQAADPLVGRLLSYRRKNRLTWKELGRRLSVVPKTMRGWRASGRVSLRYEARVRKLLNMEGKNLFQVPTDPASIFWMSKTARKNSRAAERKVLGYAAVWLHVELQDLKLNTQAVLPNAEAPATVSRVILLADNGALNASINFCLLEGALHYQALSHRVGDEAKIEMEGMADAEGFEFCREFMRYKPKGPSAKAEKLDQMRSKTIHRNARR